MANEERRSEFVRFFKALADENRLKIVGLLAERPRAVDDLAAHLGLESPTVSHHLRSLHAAGLLRSWPRAHHRFYELDVERLQATAGVLFSLENLARLASGTDASAYRRRVLATFLEGGRIRALPRADKKLRVVLGWAAAQLEPDRGYDDAALAAELERICDDPERLRSELLGQRYLVWSEALGCYVRTAVAVTEGPAVAGERSELATPSG